MRLKMTLSYNGASFYGSQVQKETKETVLGYVEEVLLNLGINSRVVASGRTDRGVHATRQVCHFDTPPFWSDRAKLTRVMNEMLPKSIRVVRIEEIAPSFHARYSAKKRAYRYIIKPSDTNPFEADFVASIWHVELGAIQEKIKLFVGEHDFVNFMKRGSDVDSTCRTIYRAYAYRHKGYIILVFEANGFLRTQIRLMVGAIIQKEAHEIQELLACGTNLACGTKQKIKPAPSQGLYLIRVVY